MSQYTILCVDTEAAVDDIRAAVESNDALRAVVRHSVAGAVDSLSSNSVDCLVTGYQLADETGLNVIEAVQDQNPDIPSILCTAVHPTNINTGSFDLAAVEYFNRADPDTLDSLGFVVEDVITHNAQAGFLLPSNKPSRLEALVEYDIESLPVEASFDRLTGLMASHFDVSVAFIGLIDRTTEEIIACRGAEWDRMWREDTVCTHSMLQDEVMVVEDITEDARFKNNDTLQRLGIVSYAGANLTTPDGNTIGQVCLIEYEPRTYSEDEKHDLQEFADLAMELLELRHTVDNPSIEGKRQ